jgi:hypothetical protein
MLGYVHFRNTATYVGHDLEPLMAAGAGAQGFTPPLGPGNFSFWLQENSTPIVNYQLNFVLSTDPPPPRAPALPAIFGVALALSIGGFGASKLRRTRSKP